MGVTTVSVHNAANLACLQYPSQPTVLVCNHIGFADPHALLEPLFDAHIETRWLAGVEPFESPIKAFHLTGNGSFSIDRGTLDRPALQYAQAVLRQHTYPLVVFPEGEAHYHVNALQPFQEGAAALLKKALQSSPVVAWLPIHLTYVWDNPKDATIHSTLSRTLHQLYAFIGQPVPAGTSASKTALPQHLAPNVDDLCRTVFQWLLAQSNIEPLVPFAPQASWPVMASQWLSTTLHALCNEHDLALDREATLSSPLALMAAKNQLRSLIVRKARAMPLKLWQRWDKQLLRWENFPQPCFLDTWAFNTAEWLLTGIPHTTVSWEKRLTNLRRHLNAQQPSDDPTPQQRQRWEDQLNICRRLKLVQLLLMGANKSAPASWEDLEATVQQLWLLVTHKQRYHGPKQAVITVGTLQEITSQSSRSLPTTAELTEQFKTAIEQLRQHL